MPTHTHRERVLRTIHHQPADRVPLDMMGNATMLLDGTYLRLRDALGLSPIPPVRSGSTSNYYDERILERFDIDFRRLMLKSNPAVKKTVLPDGSIIDAWGVRSITAGMFINVLDPPLQGATSAAEIEAYPWPSAEELYSTSGLAEEARCLYNETDFAISARNPLTFGFLDRACAMMGNAQFMVTMASNPDVAQAMLAEILKIFKGAYALFLDAVGPYVQMVEYGDDLGSQQNLLISPAMYRRFIKPAERELYALIRRKAPQAAIFRHCDGSIYKILPDFVELGVDVLNPVQTSCREMEGQRLKETFGRSLTFHGAVEKMEGGLDDLLQEVKQRIDTFAPGGGYIFASCNHMIDVPPENVIAMFDTAREYGRYEK
jgi:uroporphyrinogen decarboxylase